MEIDKRWNVSDHREDIEFIPFNSMVWQEDVMKFQIEQMVSHGPHHLVSLHIVHVQDVQIIETTIKRLTDLKT